MSLSYLSRQFNVEVIKANLRDESGAIMLIPKAMGIDEIAYGQKRKRGVTAPSFH